VDALKDIPFTSHEYDYKGRGNNPENPTFGLSGSPRIRNMPPGKGVYADDEGKVPLSEENDLPSGRRIMEELFRHPIPTKTKSLRCELLLYFGLLISIDTMRKEENTTEPFFVPCDGQLKDPIFCPATGKTYCAASNTTTEAPMTPVFRSTHVLVDGERATINGKTPFLDMDFLYGNSTEQANKIRTFEGGQLDLVEYAGAGLLPRDPSVLGDLNILPTVYSLIVVFMRFHNYVAKYTMIENPDFDDQQIYNSARNYVIGTYQKMVLYNYFPAITGDTLGSYSGYDPTINPAIDEFFGAVSYRYAHTEQPSVIRLMDPNYVPTMSDPISLRDAFRPTLPGGVPRMVTDLAKGIEPVLRGSTFTPKKPYDSYFVDDLNIFTKTSILDIQRARDVGIPPYNEVRRLMGLEPAKSIEELVRWNYFDISEEETQELVAIVQNLYNDDVEKVDAPVGVLFEGADEAMGAFGPVFDKSFKDQFSRIRLGDRFWFENVYTQKDQDEMLTLTDIIKLVCDGMDKFPWDPFAVWGTDKNEVVEEDCDAPEQTNQVSLLGGGMSMSWAIRDTPVTAEELVDDDNSGPTRTIEVTLTANEGFDGAGFMGIGWRARTMNGAEIWFCRINPENFVVTPGSCVGERQTEPQAFSCCVARGGNVVPQCLEENDQSYYPLQVIDWCLDEEESSVKIRTDVCFGEQKTSNCFEPSSNGDGTIDMIVAYNPSRVRPHGFQRRTSTVVDLKAGILTAEETAIAQEGLIAYHAITMLVFWMFLAPIGIYIVRYMKTKTWRLVAHVTIMGAVAGLSIPIIIGVEASVGATDKSQEHAVVGLVITGIVLPMFIAGRIRMLKLNGVKVGRRTARYAFGFHKFVGYCIVLASWYNCYSGLIRISPEDSNVVLVIFSSISLGYDFPVFGFIKDHIYVPYIALVCIIFLAAEINRIRLNGALHESKLKELRNGHSSIWNDKDDADLYDEMTMDKFLELTRLGSNLCIIDGRVLDISGFIDSHPGGKDMLKDVAGSDITDEITGLRDIEGFRHTHSFHAIQKMKSLVIAVLVVGDEKKSILIPAAVLSGNANIVDAENSLQQVKVNAKPLFRRARILDVRFITPFDEISETNKPVVMLCLAVPKAVEWAVSNNGSILPSACFKFRVVNAWGSTFEAYYTPVRLMRSGDDDRINTSIKEDENVYEFLISLRPGGQISKASLEWKIGKPLAVQGPSINPKILNSLAPITPSTVVTLFAAGTGIAPILQLLDFYADPARRSSAPHIFLIWVLKGPEHNYSDWLGFEQKAKKLNGKFKWIIIYSSSSNSNGTKKKRTSQKLKPRSSRLSTRDNDSASLRESSLVPTSLRSRFSKKRPSVPRAASRGRLNASKSLKKESSIINRTSSRLAQKPFAVPASAKHASNAVASNKLKLFKARNKGSLIERIRNHDPSAYSARQVEAGVEISADLEFADDFWRVHEQKALCLQLDEALVSNILASIDFYFEVKTAREYARALADAHNKSSCDSNGGKESGEGSSHTSETDETETQKAPPTREMMLADEIAKAFQESQSSVSCTPEEMICFICGSPRFDSNIRNWLESAGCEKDLILNFYGSFNVHI